MKKWFSIIVGSKEDFALEHRIFNCSSFLITAFALVASTLNWMIDLHIHTIWPGYTGALASGIIYYISRIRKVFKQLLVIIYVLLTMIILGGIYFFNDASGGTIIYLLIMLLNIYLLVVIPRYQLLVFIILSSTIFILLALEYYYPEWVQAYPDRNARILDHGATLLLSMLFTSFVIAAFRHGYINERKTVLQQNEDLLKLNRQIDDQKSELERKTDELQQAVIVAQEKNDHIETLLKELHHRVKNNLQVISGLLSLQSNRVEDDSARRSLEASRTRIEAMALIHKGLYKDNRNPARVQIDEYLVSLNESLALSFGFDKNYIETNITMHDATMDIDIAVPVGLIVNELVTNAFKYAFKDHLQPKVKVGLLQTNGDAFILTISDNGKNKIGDESFTDKNSFGLKLVRTLADQLNASVSIRQDNGTIFTIEIKPE